MASISINLELNDFQYLQDDFTIMIDKSLINSTSIIRKSNCNLFEFMNQQVKDLKLKGKIRTAEAYCSAINSIKCFLKNDIPFSDITKSLLKDYEVFLIEKGVTLNTVSFYMRILRAVYNRAVDNELTEDKHPFRCVYTGIGKTAKRAVSIEVLQKIREFKTNDKEMEFARDMFLFSFYAHGMSFIDIAYLRLSDIKDGVLSYHRKKTGQLLSMEWSKELIEIHEKWKISNNDYLLPIIKKQNGKERNQFRYVQYKVNYNLSKLGKIMELNRNLTMYVARHSWASIAHKLDIPLYIISRGLGHDSEKTTRIYLNDINTQEVDNANNKIIGALNCE